MEREEHLAKTFSYPLAKSRLSGQLV